jgi:hypothetical protein
MKNKTFAQFTVRGIFLICIVCNHQSVAQETPALITDRPTQSLSASITPIKMLLWETGTLLESTPLVETWTLNNSLFRYGVSKSVELRASTEISNATLKTTNEKEVLLSNVQLGLKYRFLNKKVQMAYTGHVIFPNDNTVISDIVGPQVGSSNILSITHPVIEVLSFGYNIGYKHEGYSTDVLLYSYVVSTGIGDRLGFFVEVYGDAVEFDDHTLSFDSGFTYLILENLQVDFSFADSFNEKYNYYSFGLSWRIGKGKQPDQDDVENY